MIRRRGIEPSHESSSDEEDAFSALSKKEKIKRDEKSAVTGSTDQVPSNSQNVNSTTTQRNQMQLPASTTSSMKRHHGVLSDTRKTKMDALLQELEAEKDHSILFRKEPSFVPDKKGSFVEPWEEHLTSNIFVGNLAPSITEEALTDMFRQFGTSVFIKRTYLLFAVFPLNCCRPLFVLWSLESNSISRVACCLLSWRCFVVYENGSFHILISDRRPVFREDYVAPNPGGTFT
jgi:hypothetical protein